MKRTILIWSITLVVLIVFGGLAYLWHDSKRYTTTNAIRAIPADATIVVKSNDFERLIQQLHEQNEFWIALSDFNLISNVNRFFEFSESLKERSATFEQLIYKNNVFLSVHIVGKGTPTLFYTASIPDRVRPSEVKNLIAENTGENYTISTKDYNGVSIYTYTMKDDELEESFSFAITQGVVMLSQSVLLVESSIGQLGSNVSLLEDTAFVEALKTAGTRVVANVLVNHLRLPSLINQHLHKSQQTSFSTLSHVANWSELDITLKDRSFYLNGFTQVSDTTNSFYRVLSKQKPVEMRVPQILPAQTAALVFLGISDIDSYFNSYQKYLEEQGKLVAYNQKLERLGKSLGVNLQSFYSSFFGEELTLAFIPFQGESYNNCWFTVAEVRGQSLAKQEFITVLESFGKKNGQPLSAFEKTFAIDREKSVKIYRFPSIGLHESLFGNLFAIADDQYFAFIDSYIVFGSSVEALSRFILSNIHNMQLSVDESFKQFSQSLTTESNFTAYVSPGKSEMLYGKKLNPTSASRILSRIETVSKIQGLAVQLTGGKKMIFNNICARYSPYSIDAPKTVWETRLDTNFSMKPQLVINHITQNREIFVQDHKNTIYLINDIGRVLWKRPLAEAIIGEVTQVDIYRNGRLQFLFNTKSHLYLIDRNGNNVDGFPVKLRSPATNPVAVFDYEGNRNYRFFVAGEDRKVYVYNRSGNIVTGWDFDKTEKIVTQPIQHFRVAARDYIVMADENRPYILDRRGNERVRPNHFFSKGANSSIVLDEGSTRNPPRFVTTDSLGIVRFIYLDGRIDERAIIRLNNNHFFDYQDVDGNGRKDFIFLNRNKLLIYKNDGNELFSHTFAHDLIPQVVYFHFGGRDRKLGVTCSVSSQIYLINGDGNFYKGFPLRGITPFSIGRFASTKSTFNLIVGSSTGYVLNYAVQ